MGGLNSGSMRRSGRTRDLDLHRLSITDVRRAFGLRRLAGSIEAITQERIGFAVAVVDGGRGYTFEILADRGPDTIAYGLAEALSSAPPRQFISLTVTQPHLGGRRYWLRCPRPSCRRRCSVLYRNASTNARAFACRACTRMRYATQVFGDADRTSARIDKLVMKLNVHAGGKLTRPKGMHMRTYEGILQEIANETKRWCSQSPLHRDVQRRLVSLERAVAAHGATGYADGTPFSLRSEPAVLSPNAPRAG